MGYNAEEQKALPFRAMNEACCRNGWDGLRRQLPAGSRIETDNGP